MTSKILDVIVGLEDKALGLARAASEPVVGTVGKGVRLVGGRIGPLTYPPLLPTPLEVVDAQAAFARKVVEANASVAREVLEAVAPVAGYASPVKKGAKAKAA
ncbi:MAG: hypothetical protein AB7L84_06370 [Acidimicrobiia bacterium]